MSKEQRVNNILKWVKKTTSLILIIIFIVGIAFRFYNTPGKFGFDQDPTRDVLITEYITSSLHFPLIGPISGIAPFTFGPWYYYELAFFRFIIPTPYAAFYFIPIFSLLLIPLMYLIGRQIQDEKLGLILAGFAALTPAQIGPTSGLSNPNLVPPHAAAVILLFLLLYKKPSTKLALLLGIVLGIGINHHYELVPFILFPIVAFIKHYRRLVVLGVSFLAGLVIPFIPMIIFNLTHDFQTVKGVLLYLTEGNGKYVPNSTKIYLHDFWVPFWSYVIGVPTSIGIVMAVLVVLCNAYLFIKRTLPVYYWLILGIFGVIFIGLRFTPFERFYYYFLFLIPLILLCIGILVRQAFTLPFGKIIFCLVAILFIGMSFPMNNLRFQTSQDFRNIRQEYLSLQNIIPTGGAVIYNCHMSRIEHAQGITFHLINNHKLSLAGRKIGIQDPFFTNGESNACKFPKDPVKNLGSNMYDLSNSSDEALKKAGWLRVTPQDVFARSFRSE